MYTHIIIPIKDIKSIIKAYKKDIQASENGGDTIRAAAITHMMSGLETALIIGKQISLNEKDIEEKAVKALLSLGWGEDFHFYSAATNRYEGYKQALKDLL